MLNAKYFIFLKFFFYLNFVYTDQIDFDIDKKFRELSSELRCMVCQNQSLLDSDSELAKDLKEVIYEKLNNGITKKEIKKYLVERYGEFILFKPMFNYSNLLLWLAPMISFFIIAIVGFKKIKFKQKK